LLSQWQPLITISGQWCEWLQDRSGKLPNIRLHLMPFRLPNTERPKMGMFEFDSIAVEEVVASTNSHAIMNACWAADVLGWE
jgi:hypothetical protein